MSELLQFSEPAVLVPYIYDACLGDGLLAHVGNLHNLAICTYIRKNILVLRVKE
jgi:hypothetical protein